MPPSACMSPSTRWMRAAGLRGAGREAAHLDQHQRQAELGAREAVALQVAAAQLARVLLLDVREVERRRRLVVVEQRAGLLGVLPVQPRPRSARGSVCRSSSSIRLPACFSTKARSAAKPVRTSLTSLLRVARGRAPRDRRGTARPPAGASGAADVDEDAQVLQPGHAAAQLLDRDHAGRVARQQLLDVAAQVAVERARSARPPGSPAAAPAPRAALPWRSVHATKRRVSGPGAGEWVGGHVGRRSRRHDTEELAERRT